MSSHFASDVLAERDATTESGNPELLPGAAVAHFSCQRTVDARFKYTGVLLLANTEALEFASIRVCCRSCRAAGRPIRLPKWLSRDDDRALSEPAERFFCRRSRCGTSGTFWHTDELASLLLLTRFYELWLNRQMTPAQAMRRIG